MNDFVNTISLIISLILLVFVIKGVSTVSTCVVTKHSTWVLDSTGISRYDQSAEKLLAQSPVFDALSACLLKSKARDLFNAYNGREHALAQAQGRLDRMYACKRCSKSTYEKLCGLVGALRAQNNELRTQYDSLLRQGEIMYARKIADSEEEHNEQLLRDTDWLLEKHRKVTYVTGDDGRVLTTQYTMPQALNESNPVVTKGESTEKSVREALDVKNISPQCSSGSLEQNDDTPNPQELLDAVMKSREDRVDYLLSRGVNPNSITGDKKKGLVHLATDRDSLAIVKRLVEGNANVNIRNVEKRTALYSAIYHRNAEIVEFLISSRASTNIEDKWGITPLDFAKERKCSNRILNLLKK